jgi:CubicO group peptidase (beta-lactamase class C family)
MNQECNVLIFLPSLTYKINPQIEYTMTHITDRLNLRVFGFATLAFIAFFSCTANAQTLTTKQLTSEFDRLLSEQFKPGETGCAAVVAQKGQIVYKKAFGMANLELNVPMQPDMVFLIGSITKQFTAVAILQLMEQGKLSLQDEITRFIPDYPTNGYKITIEHLLTHTSGIKSYTNLPEYMGFSRNDLTPEDVIKIFKNQPMEFAPGTKWSYCNSGYFLLGYIIEKASGKTYKEYIEENFFKPLNMTGSCYGNDSKVIKNRASGYQTNGDEVINARYVSMLVPYSAGAIQSTVEDLFKWNQALHSYKLLRKETLEKAFADYKLPSGKGTGYGYGWMLQQVQGSPTIEHGGSINGFQSNALYLPQEDVFVAVFSNSNAKSPDLVSTKMAAVAIGKPYKFTEIKLDEGTLDAYPGVYENEQKDERTIIKEGDQLFSQRAGGPMNKIKPYEKDKFFFENSFTTIEFKRNAENKIISVNVNDRASSENWIKTDKKVTVRKEVDLSESVLDQYVGDYQLTPGFVISVTRENNKMFTQATGQTKVEIFAESETKFFLKVVDAQLEFVRDETGKFSKLILYQGGQKMEGLKIK